MKLFDRKDFGRRYNEASSRLTTIDPVTKTEKVPTREEIIASIKEEDLAAEEYQSVMAPTKSQTEQDVTNRTRAALREGAVDAVRPDTAPTPELLKKAGQKPKKPGGYSDIQLTNGKFVPNSLAPFIDESGFDISKVEAYAVEKAKKSNGKYTKEDVIAVITRELAALTGK